MKYSTVLLALASIVLALDGQFGIHDPSSVVLCNGKYYAYGTGGRHWSPTAAGRGAPASGLRVPDLLPKS